MKVSTLEPFAVALLATGWLLWGSNMLGNLLVRVEPARPTAAARDAAPRVAAKAAKEEAGPVDLKTLLASATPGAGEKVFKKCAACHTPGKGQGHRVGPNLWEVVGRAKGKTAGFAYSGAMAAAGGEWTYEDLNKFLAKPKDFAPGNKMTFVGLAKAAERAEVIAYLRTLSESPKPLP